MKDYITILLGVAGRPVLFHRVGDFNVNTTNARQSLRHALGEVHGTVLASGAAEGDLKMVAAIAPVLLDRLADKRLGRLKERLDRPWETGEEVTDGLVAPRVAA